MQHKFRQPFFNYQISLNHFITKIENSYNETIEFNYEDEKYSYDEPASYTEKKILAGLNNITNYSLIGAHVPYCEIENNDHVINRGKRLKTITVSNGENISFIYDTCPRLDLPYSTFQGGNGIEVLNGGYALKKVIVNQENIKNEFDFDYEYFNLSNYNPCVSVSDNTLKDSYRLKLKSVVKIGEAPYKFIKLYT